MKYLDLTLRGDGSKIIYPVKYEEEIANFNVEHLYYEDGAFLKLLLCIPDKDFKSTMVRTDVVEINETQAKAISEAKETRTETILDEAKLRRLELKAQIGMNLTTAELDSIDPAKPDSVFGVSEILADKIVKIKAKEIK
jgi:hypothetical protein